MESFFSKHFSPETSQLARSSFLGHHIIYDNEVKQKQKEILKYQNSAILSLFNLSIQ